MLMYMINAYGHRKSSRRKVITMMKKCHCDDHPTHTWQLKSMTRCTAVIVVGCCEKLGNVRLS